MGYLFFDYLPLYKTLPSQSNLQVFGIYNRDKANADEVRSFFSLLPRRKLVTFPYLSYKAHFPNKHGEKPDISDLTGLIVNLLEKDMYPAVNHYEMPCFFNQKSMELLYYEKFGSYPPPPKPGRPVEYLSVSLPKSSVYYYSFYDMFDRQSVERSRKGWEDELGRRPHRILRDESTKDYSILAAIADYRKPDKGYEVDWASLDSIRSFIAVREKEGGPVNSLWKFSAWVLKKI